MGAGLPTTKEAERAEVLGRDVYEYVKQIDYDQVWGGVGGVGGGAPYLLSCKRQLL